MATEHSKLKLGKRATFVKTQLKQLPQSEETWEADFQELPKETHGGRYLYEPTTGTVRSSEVAERMRIPVRRRGQ